MAKQKQTTNKLIKIPQSILTFFKQSYAELKKVSWPSRETTIRYTTIVIVSSIVLGFVIGGIDYVLTIVVEKVIL